MDATGGRPGYSRLKLPLAEVKPAILGHAEFAAFQQKATRGFRDWRKATTPRLTGFDKARRDEEMGGLPPFPPQKEVQEQRARNRDPEIYT